MRAAVALAARLALPVVATHPVQFLARRRLRGARGAGLRRRRRDARQPAPRQALQPRAVLQDARRRWRQLFADLPSALANIGRDRQALQPEPGARQAAAARLRDADRRRRARADGRVLPDRLAPGSRGAPGAALPRCRGARARAAALRRAARLRDRDDPEDGLPRLLPDRRRLHQLGAEQRLPGRARARLGRRLAGRVFAQHHRPRPAALQAAVRALPQPRAGVDARLRHRLLPGQSRPRDRLRQGQVRPRRGEPDRDLRHDGGEGGAARHRPRARHELRPRRLDRQAGAGAAGQDGDAEAPARAARQQRHLRAPRGARDRAAREARGRGRRAARARRARRGPGAQRRHARRRRADRARQDHRLLPALHAARQRQRGEPVRQGRRRGDRPGEVRLPRPGDADDPRARQGLHRRPPSRAARLRLRRRCRSTTPRSTRCSPKAAPSRCSSSKAAACGAC